MEVQQRFSLLLSLQYEKSVISFTGEKTKQKINQKQKICIVYCNVWYCFTIHFGENFLVYCSYYDIRVQYYVQ
jgi:hypothetical protein